jgi:hypothetical protein
MGHETPRNPRAAPDAKGARCRPASVRQDLSIHSRDPECVNQFGGALGTSSSQGGRESALAQACAWASADADTATAAPLVAVAGTGVPVRRICDRSVDPAAHRHAHRETFRDTLSSRPCVAGDAGLGLDVSEAGAAGAARGRARHRALEDTRVATDKKAQRLGAHRVFLDESGCLLIPNARKTWAPIGQTPLFKPSYRRDRMSVISSITVSPSGQHLGL